MTASATVPAIDARQIDIADLRIAPWNARKTFDPATMAEFTSNLETHGIQVPLLVRPIPGPAYEIVAGHRRFKAALALCDRGNLQFEYLPCLVRELTDEEARERGLVDNLQREDVPPLEEAEAYSELMPTLGSVAAIAARVGKEVAYVARRLQLVLLAPMPRKALAERLITVDHALLLARLGEEEQNVNLKWALDVNAGIKTSVESVIEMRIKDRDSSARWSGYWEPQSVLDLKHHIEKNVGRKLSRAPWSLDDTTLLQQVPACNSCPSNTKHNDLLFGDLNIAAATCENGVCFDQKRAAFVQIRLGKIPEETIRTTPPPGLNGVDRYIFPLRLSWKYSTVVPRLQRKGFKIDREGFAPDQVFRHGQWIEAKPKSCNFVRQGVTVDWSDDANRGYMGSGEKLRKPGQILFVCISDKCKVHKKSYAAASKGSASPDDSSSSSRRQTLTEEQKKQNEAAAEAENKIRGELVTRAIDQVKKVEGELLRRLVLRAVGEWLPREDEKRFPGLIKRLKAAKPDSLEFARAAACVLFTTGDTCEDDAIWAGVRYDGVLEPLDRGRKSLIKLLTALGIKDAAQAWEKPAETKPTPKKKATRK